jgi:hypothetical protein
MTKITPQTIAAISEKLDRYSDKELKLLTYQLHKEQPALVRFILETGRSFHDPEPEQLLLHHTLLIWSLFQTQNQLLPMINESLIQKTENKILTVPKSNAKEALSEETTRNYQSGLISYIDEAISRKGKIFDLDLPTFKIMATILTIVIECFHEINQHQHR